MMNASSSYLYANELVSSFDSVDTSSSRIRKSKNTPLGNDYVPSNYDVLCGRGKESFNHVGNRRFRVTIGMNLKKYMEAQTKIQKTLVVVSIVDMIRSLSPNGGFVKQDADGKWYEIGDKLARAKVGHALRDLIVSLKRSEERKTAKQHVPQSQQAILLQRGKNAKLESPLDLPDSVQSSSLNKTLNDGDVEPLPVKETSFVGIFDNDVLLENVVSSDINTTQEICFSGLFDDALPDTIGSEPRLSAVFRDMETATRGRIVSFDEATC